MRILYRGMKVVLKPVHKHELNGLVVKTRDLDRSSAYRYWYCIVVALLLAGTCLSCDKESTRR